MRLTVELGESFLEEIKDIGTSSEIANAFTYASLGERFCAGFIDSLIMGVFAFGIGKIAHVSWIKEVMEVIFTIAIAFFISSHYQGTPGKIILGLKTTNVDGEKIGFLRALGRSAFYSLSYFVYISLGLMLFAVKFQDYILMIISLLGMIVFGIMPIVGYLMIAFSKRKQGLHDKIFGTIVIRKQI
jgi:uncharacterized RDD family membrane protein YckC